MTCSSTLVTLIVISLPLDQCPMLYWGLVKVQAAQCAAHGGGGTTRNAAAQPAVSAHHVPVRRRMQNLGRLGTLDSQQATIEATLRLKELGEEEACTQAGIVIDLIFGLWEPIQAVCCGASSRA